MVFMPSARVLTGFTIREASARMMALTTRRKARLKMMM
jgi:hypothetical protein